MTFRTQSKLNTAARAAIATIGLALCQQSLADPALGTWRTEAADNGGYLYVNIAPCDDKVCGTIVKAFNKDDEEGDDYEHLGKKMIYGMLQKGDGNYAKGKIWAPDVDKTYNSKMKIKGGELIVSGCVAFICRSQTWVRVN